jgi:hypothetical protein
MPPSATLLDHPHLWRRGAPRTVAPGLATGHAALDAVLPGGGLPAQALTEILLADPGHGEWTLLLPLLARAQGSIALVAPPLLPYPPALLRHGVDVERLLLVATRDARETLWASEQCLRSGACDAVLLWLGEWTSVRGEEPLRRAQRNPGAVHGEEPLRRAQRNPGAVHGEEPLRRAQRDRNGVSNHSNHSNHSNPSPAQALRRLQLACEAGRTPGIVFRDPARAMQSSPAALRLCLHAGEVEVIKCRGAAPGARVTLEA